MADYNKEALAIWKSLQPIIDKEIDARTKSMVQRRKAIVTTAPSSVTKTIGVTEPFGDEYFVPFLPGVSGAQVNDAVWVEFMFGASNAFVSMFANISDTEVGGGGPYAGSNADGGPATVSNALHWGKVHSSSTSTAFVAASIFPV